MKIYLSSILLFLTLGCSQETGNNKSTSVLLELPEKMFDFGQISQRDTVIHRFELINSGQEPLIIKDVNTSCGCTVPVWNKEPILPSKKGFVEIQYVPNSPGQISKSIVIETNTDSTFTVLYLKGFVKNEI